MKRIRCSITTDRHYKLSYKNSPKNKKNDYFTEINLEAQIDDESKSSINKSLKSITDVDFIPYVENQCDKNVFHFLFLLNVFDCAVKPRDDLNFLFAAA